MELYVLYRNFEASIDLVDLDGNKVDANGIDDLSVVFAGARIKF